MRAVWYSKFGAASEVVRCGEMDVPEPGEGEVLVRIATSGVNPVDVKRRAGGRGEMTAPRVIPHFDGAGTIDRVGAGVPADRIGERVWIFEAQWQRDRGTAAEFVALAADRVVPLPDNTSFAEGACLGIPAMSAHRCVFGDGSVERRTLLVSGGAGAVGNYAVQFASLGDAQVIATVSNEQKATLARNAGADHVIHYKTENVVERVREITDGAGVDRIVEVEFGGNLDASIAILKSNGVIASYASEAVAEPVFPFYPLLYKNATIRCELVFGMPESAKREAVADITSWLVEGKLRHHVGQRFPLEATASAHEAVEQGAFGKVVLEIGETG